MWHTQVRGLGTSLCSHSGTNRDLGEIGFNFPNYEAGKMQSVSFTTQVSYYEKEVKQYAGREFRLTLLFHGAPKYVKPVSFVQEKEVKCKTPN